MLFYLYDYISFIHLAFSKNLKWQKGTRVKLSLVLQSSFLNAMIDNISRINLKVS